MKYALNLGEDNRVLSATYEDYAAEGSVLVDELPEGDLSDYRYLDGVFYFDPLSRQEAGNEDHQPVTWAELQNAYEEGVATA